ncbi:MAG: hypothetical protein OXF56_11255, partial [Rhodobacteraceae bacterium]|nr:hypothetical protein [Paracoccaceae bacterium]
MFRGVPLHHILDGFDERVAPRLEIRELVEARRGRRQQDDISRLGFCRSGFDRLVNRAGYDQVPYAQVAKYHL